MKLGVIISDVEMNLGDNFECINYDVTYDYDGLPTLYVGMAAASDTFSDVTDLDILDRKIDKNTFWTFTRKEHRTHHAEDVMDFIDFCYNKVIENVEYKFIDPLLMSKEYHDLLFSEIKGGENLISYRNKDMVYLYNSDNFGKIYGINLMFYTYIGVSIDKMLDRINTISSTFLEGEDILIEYKDFMEAYDDQVRYIPYLYSIIKCQQGT